MRDHFPWQSLLGMLEPDPVARRAAFALFSSPSPAGRSLRQQFQAAIENTETEFHGLGVEMNMRYVSPAVNTDDETDPPPEKPADEIRTHQVGTYPGKRLPHVWLNTRIPGKRVSTVDLAGHGRFCLFTGPGGDGWRGAAERVSGRIGVEVVVYSIGWGMDWEDVYFDWARVRGVEEDGCVLVRPDRFVAWRAGGWAEGAEGRLEGVLRGVLAL